MALTVLSDPLNPPAYVREQHDQLRAALDSAYVPLSWPDSGVPRKTSENLLLATWNIRDFGGLTRKWQSKTGESPRRDLLSVLLIAELVSRFDVVAIQETGRETTALQEVLTWLNRDDGDRRQVVASDVTAGTKNGYERLGYVYDTTRVTLSGLVAELVVPPDGNRFGVNRPTFDRGFARTPYAASFRSGDEAGFVLTTLHVTYGGKRMQELTAIAKWLRAWVRDDHVWEQDVLALGDFNIDREGDANWQAFISSGLHVPLGLLRERRTITNSPNPGAQFYDQIGWFGGGQEGPSARLAHTGRAAQFEWEHHILNTSQTSDARTYRMSDHRPFWVEFQIDR